MLFLLLLLLPKIIVTISIYRTPFQYTEAEITLFRIVQPEEPPKSQEYVPNITGIYDEIRNILEQKKVECEQYCTPDDIDGKTDFII